MLIKHIVVETSISDCETGKLPGVSIRVTAAFDGGCDQTKLQKLLVEEARVSTKITDQIADLSPDGGIVVNYQVFEILVDVGRVNILIEVLRNPRQLGDQRQGVNNYSWAVISGH